MLRRGIVPPPEMSRRAYRDWRARRRHVAAARAASRRRSCKRRSCKPRRSGLPEDDPQRALMKGMRLALIGFGLTLAFGVAFGGYRGNPVILGGLIPMFVGIAQIHHRHDVGGAVPGRAAAHDVHSAAVPAAGAGRAPASAAARLRRAAAAHPAAVGAAAAVRGALQAGPAARRALAGKCERDGSPERPVPFDVA